MPLATLPCFRSSDGDCDLCVVACPDDAIRFIATRAGTRMAEIITARCNDCGLCIVVCPAGAIVNRPPPRGAGAAA